MLKKNQGLHKIISISIQRATLNIIALLPQLERIRAVSLDVLLKHIIPLTMKHFEYIILKLLANKEDQHSLLHQDFIKKLAECTADEHFITLANEIKNKMQYSPQLQQLSNMVKFKLILDDLSDFYSRRFRSELTARRIKQTSQFARDLALSGSFRTQLYEHAASIFALMEQNSPTLLIHFESLISLGSVTKSLARQQDWNEDYIQRVQNLHKLENYDAQNWMEPFNRYLEARHEHKNAAAYFKVILNPYFTFQW